MAFLKQASLKIEHPDISVDSWVGGNHNIRTAANKIVEYKKIIADFDPDKYLLTHCTIVASVDVEEASKPIHFESDKTKDQYKKIIGRKDYYITPSTSKYMNANGDAWSRDLLKNSYKTFIGAENYVEHVQDPALSKGKILDAIAREVDDNKSIFVDILVATNKKHSDLVNKIKTGQLQTLSMGAVVAFTICSQCGRVASDETELCSHIKFLKRNHFISENDGKKRITAELCGHFLYPESNKFIEGSWVETPAFKGAVMRNEVNVDNIDKIGFEADMSSFIQNLNIADENLAKTASRIFKAFKLVDSLSNSFQVNSKNEDIEDQPEEVKDVPIEDIDEENIPELEEDDATEEKAPEEDAIEDKKEETEEKAPVERVPEELPEEITEMGEPEEDSLPEDEALEQESKKPYDVLKEEIKEQLKDQIKKELLKDLGIDLGETKTYTPGIQNTNLNDTLVKSSLNRIKSACIMAKEVGLKNITSYGYTKKDLLKIAELSKKYSINKEVFEALYKLDSYEFPTFRRYAKNVEEKLGRDLTNEERFNLDNLVKDILK